MDLIISLNKPKGITSHGATVKVKRIFKTKKAGHTGTLDPIATGVLLICINRATRLSSYFSSFDKEYKAVMKLGEITNTQDADGTVIEKNDRIEVDETMIKNTLKSFEGEILQKPPMFSALKYKGKPLYKYAKRGINISLEPRKTYIHHIEFLNMAVPFVCFRVVCSKGTYIRTLCNDIGEKLGTGAHLFELERIAIGPFSISDSLSIEELNSIDLSYLFEKGGKFPKGIYAIDSALSWMPELKIEESLIKDVKNGVAVNINRFGDFPDALKIAAGIKIKSPDGELLAIGSFSRDKNAVRMDVVFGGRLASLERKDL
jgi:tRNA pseudouridine55 synthase